MKIKIDDIKEINKKFIPVELPKDDYIQTFPNKIETKNEKNSSLETKKTSQEKDILIKNSKYIKTDKELNISTVVQQKNSSIINNDLVANLDGAKINKDGADRVRGPYDTGIDYLNGIVDNTLAGANSAVNYLDNTIQNFNPLKGVQANPSEIDNFAINEGKSNVYKTVDLTADNAVPYSIDDTLKAFAGQDITSGVINGVLNIVDNIAGSSFYDTDEILQITSANYSSMAGPDKIFGIDLSHSGKKPEIKIKKMIDGSYQEFSTNEINDVKFSSRENLGYLYVRPFANNITVNPFKIPFQTSAKITEDTISANYASEQFLNRIGEMKSYISTSNNNLTLETTYIVLNDYEINTTTFGNSETGSYKPINYDGYVPDYNLAPTSDKEKARLLGDLVDNKTKEKINPKSNTAYSQWMEQWTPSYVKAIENAYRSLVYPASYIDTSDKYNLTLVGVVKPPVIRININNTKLSLSTNELYTYPKGKWSIRGDNTDIPNMKNSFLSLLYKDQSTYTTQTTSSGAETTENFNHWSKAYVATGVNISYDENGLMNYDETNGTMFYMSFKVTLTLSEITENYLDCIPDFRSYYTSFSGELTKL